MEPHNVSPSIESGPLHYKKYDYECFVYGSYASEDVIILCITILICPLGGLVNGYMSWLLGFRLKRNAFTTYILNMTVADLGTLLFLWMYAILLLVDSIHGLSHHGHILETFLQIFSLSTCTASLSFLTITGLERGLAVLFPGWYQRHSSSFFPSWFSCLVWILIGMFCEMHISFYLVYHMQLVIAARIMILANFWIFPPLMGVSTLVLLAKTCCRSQQQQPRKLNIVILLLLLFGLNFHGFLIFRAFINTFKYCQLLFLLSHLLTSIEISIKPIFYLFVGKQCRCFSSEPLKILLQRVFQDDVYYGEQNESRNTNIADDVTCEI